jgi:predicted nucleotidyltransferase
LRSARRRHTTSTSGDAYNHGVDVAELTARVQDAVAPVNGIAAVYLFGSVAAGTDTSMSDVDLGVLYEATPASRLDAGPPDLEAELERRLERPVQLVVLNTAPVDLRIRVLRAQRLLVDRNRPARIRFEVATRNEFFDLEPMLLEYRRPRGPRP